MSVKNLVPKLQQDYSIIFYDEKDSSIAVFKIDPPFMYDGNGEINREVTVTLAQEKKNYVLSWIPNNGWLNSKNRKYPIIIDPSIGTSLEVKSIEDTFIGSGIASEPRKYADRLGVGKGIYSGTTRSLIKFTLPSELTTGDMITNAALYLNLLTTNYESQQINVHKITTPWSSDSATWNNKPSYEEKISDYKFIQGEEGALFDWDITEMVKEWSSTGNNYGVLLKNSDENIGYNEFISSDSTELYMKGRPRIRIEYVNNSGLENYWTYHSQDLGRAGTGYVNDFNGNVIFIHNDLTMTGSRMPLTLNHVYNSNDRSITSNYGYGWRLNLSQRVEPKTIGGNQWYVYTDEDGTKHYFYYESSSGTYKQYMGTDLTFTKGSDGSYTIKDKDGGVLEFVPGGYLYKIKDKNGNSITLSYDGIILKKITDGAGRVTILDVLSNGYLVGIIEPDGSRTSFAYNGAQLSQITYPDGNYTIFTYDNSNNLTNVRNYDKYNVTYNYNTQPPYRVKQIQEIGTDGALGGNLSIDYRYNTSTFTTIFPDGRRRNSIYQFNDYGNTISIRDEDGSAEYYKYMTENLSNKLSLASKPQKFSKNYLKNHNVELQNLDWGLDSWGIPDEQIGTVGSGIITTEASYMGRSSLKINRIAAGANRLFYSQGLSLPKGKSYVFSAYVKTVDIKNERGKGAAIFVNYYDSSNIVQTVESRMIQGTSNWTRYEVKFTLPDNAASNTVYARAGIIEEMGTAYFDCFQLEEGTIANRYNLVENADLSYGDPMPIYWTRDPQSDQYDKVIDIDGKRAYRIFGASRNSKYLAQSINISGKKGDSFVVSVWAKGESVPLIEGRRFSLEVGMEKADKSLDWYLVSFNEDSTDWQYVSEKIVAKSDYVRIIIYGEYYNNANAAYFTNFQIYKEEFGVSYVYDENGNVISVVDLAKKESKFEYQNNDLVKAINPAGGKFEYKYDKNRNIEKAISAENVVYSFTYDSYGNPLTSTVSSVTDANSPFIKSTANYSISGNYMKAITDERGDSVINHYDEAKGLLTGTTDGKGSKTSYQYDNMNRLVNASKILEASDSKNVERFPLISNTIGSKGTKTVTENAVFDKDSGGKSAFAAFDAGTNLLVNSSFEGTGGIGSTSSWALEDWDNSTGRWRLVYDGVNGSYCLESYDSDGVVNGSATNSVAYQFINLPSALSAPKVYTLSSYAKRIGTENPELGIQCFDAAGKLIAGTYQNYVKSIPENQWVRISQTFTFPAGTRSFFVILRTHVKDNNKVRFDAIQMEENSIFTPYTLSNRGNSKLYYDLGIDKKSGTMAVWFNTKGSGTRIIFSNEGSGVLFNLYINDGNKIILSSIDKSNVFRNIITASDITILNNTWYFVALEWQWVADETTHSSVLNCTLYINDRVYTGSTTEFKDFTGVITAVGSNVYGLYQLNGFLEGFSYSRNPLSNDDIQDLYTRTLQDDRITTVANSYTYESDRIKTISHNGFSYKFEYDSFGNNNRVLVENQPLITNNFEPITGNLLSSIYGNNQKVSMVYDELDRIISRKFNEKERYTYQYDSSGNLGYHEDKINNRSYRYVYDLADRLVRVEEAATNDINYIRLGYDSNNNENRITQKVGGALYETKYEYDKDNKQRLIFYGEPSESDERIEYFSFNGSTVSSKGRVPIPDIQTPVFQRDESGKNALAAYSGTKVVYDLGINKSAGTVSAWINTSGTGSRMIIGNEGSSQLFNLYVDGNNKVNLAVLNNVGVFTNVITTEETITPDNWEFVALQWFFDSSSGVLKCTLYLNSKPYTANVTSFKDFTGAKTAVGSNPKGGYNLNGLIRNFTYAPTSIISESSILAMYHRSKVEYRHDSIGRLSEKIVNAGLNSYGASYEYVKGISQGSTTNKLKSIRNKNIKIEYEYDANGNITKIIDAGKVIEYQYNELNELVKEKNGVTQKTIDYLYDSGGNILQRIETPLSGTTSVTTGSYQYDSIWKDKLTHYNGKEITYDNVGNPLTYNNYSYTWEEGRRLKSIKGNGYDISFKYNDSGIRIEKNVNGVTTKYYLIGDKVSFEDNGSDRIYYTYDSENDLISMNLNGTEYYYIRNGQGDIIGLFDSNGTQVVTYLYDSWGRVLSAVDNTVDKVGDKNPYRYRGYRYDKETGLYY
ncbi:DNRLRE domain-containing protein, partial [Clostridium sp. CX1]|uniref:DNRLRE domain-containing protein n=1 Tax=Clostridium sp. CX1 TaxID=2978346 RepID=UPI0021BFE47F